MTHYSLYYHLFWSTYHRAPMIDAVIRPVLHEMIQFHSHAIECVVHAVNSVPDHIHISVTIPPKIAISEFVGKVKANSGREINIRFRDRDEAFRWQRGYGVQSFGRKQLVWVNRYIATQAERHRTQDTYAFLEPSDFD